MQEDLCVTTHSSNKERIEKSLGVGSRDLEHVLGGPHGGKCMHWGLNRKSSKKCLGKCGVFSRHGASRT